MNKPIYNSQQILTNQQLADQIRRDFLAILDADITRYQATRTYRRYAKKANHPRVTDVTWLANKITADIPVSELMTELLAYLNSGDHFKYFAKFCSVRRDILQHIAEFKVQYAAALPLIEGNLSNLIFNDPAQAGPPGPRLEQQPVPAEQLLHNPILASMLNEIENQKRVIRDLQSTVEQQQATIQQQSSRIERLVTRLGEILKNGISFLNGLLTYKKQRQQQEALQDLLKATEKEIADPAGNKVLRPSHIVIHNALQPAVAHVDPPIQAPQLAVAPAPPPPPPFAAQAQVPPPPPPFAAPAPLAVQQQSTVVSTRSRAQTIPAPTTVIKEDESDSGLNLAMCSALAKLRKVPKVGEQLNTEPTITTPINITKPKPFEVSKPATAVGRSNAAPQQPTAENTSLAPPPPPPPPPASAPTPVVIRTAPHQTPAQPTHNPVDSENNNANAEDPSLNPTMLSALKSLKKVDMSDRSKPAVTSPQNFFKTALRNKFKSVAPPPTPKKPGDEEQKDNLNDTFEL